MLLIELAPPPAPIPPARPSRSEPGSHTTRNADIAAPEGVAIDSVAHVPELSVPPFRLPTPSIPAGGGIAEGDGLGSEGDGSGGAGTGAGAGGGDAEDFTEARQIRGRFRNSDFPESAEGATPLRVGVRFAVGPAGRVDQCEIIAPSGYPELDAMTCRVIIDRYRFRPARDGQGVAVTEVMEEAYTWVSHDRVRTQN
ncbi:energy transducer TonB [Sphingomonas sp. DBB INV C78]|uniref:energy transducer TonB n=1 Tax=Sphingomonas sp. DBB INV C78 TaxID=3349434 RepID=UPI0036D32571